MTGSMMRAEVRMDDDVQAMLDRLNEGFPRVER